MTNKEAIAVGLHIAMRARCDTNIPKGSNFCPPFGEPHSLKHYAVRLHGRCCAELTLVWAGI